MTGIFRSQYTIPSSTKVVTYEDNRLKVDGSTSTFNAEESTQLIFNLSDSSLSGHPFTLATANDESTNYANVTSSGTPGQAGATLTTTLPAYASNQTLWWYCSNSLHSSEGASFAITGADGVVATGGSITTYSENGNTYKAHTFTSTALFYVTGAGIVEYLVVGGGGATGTAHSHGGDGGQFKQITDVTISIGQYQAVVGNGGSPNGNSGGNSSFNGTSSVGGAGNNANAHVSHGGYGNYTANSYSGYSGGAGVNSTYRNGSTIGYSGGGVASYSGGSSSHGGGGYYQDGVANTGGGAGNGLSHSAGEYGGSGIVVVRYIT
jgi:hypothetical protein